MGELERPSDDRDRTPRGHIDEVREFLARSRGLVQHLSRHVERVRASAFAISDRVERTEDMSERFAAALEEASAFMAHSRAVERIYAELDRGCALLEREHAKYVDASQSNPVPTLITDGTSRVRDANRAAAAALGVEQGTLPGRMLVVFVARQDVRRFHDFSRPLWKEMGDETREVVLRMRPRGHHVQNTRLSVHCVRTSRHSRVGLRWTLQPADNPAA